jgi:hypothetical protein
MDDGYAIAQGVVHPWYFELSSKPKAAEATPYELVLGRARFSRQRSVQILLAPNIMVVS